MARLTPIDRESAPEATQKMLAKVEDKLGMVPNPNRHHGPVDFRGRSFLRFAEALSDGVLSNRLREQIA